MRIAIVASRFPVLSETFVLAQVTGLIKRGHDVTVFAERPPDGSHVRTDAHIRYWPREIDASLVSHVARALPRASLRIARALIGCVGKSGGNWLARRAAFAAAEEPFDAIVCHFGNVALEAQQLRDIGALTGKLAAVFHAHELTTLLNDKGPDFYAPLFARAERILPVSEYWARKLESLGCPPHKITVHHMGVDCELLSFRSRKPPSAGEPMALLSVARLVEKKGLGYAIEAVARAASEGVPIRYRVIGDGPLRAELHAKIAEFGAEEHITLLGARTHDEVLKHLDEAHVFVAPSVTANNGDMEGIPVSIMEAMARGLVVLSTEHSGIPELVEDGVSGRLVAERDVDALAESLRDLASAPEAWAELSSAARRVVEDRFNEDRLNDALEAMLAAL